MLNNALDLGISEQEFWEMTFAELDRLANSKLRMEKYRAQERATFDYIHAVLIGRAIAGGDDFPDIATVYPTLFNAEDKQRQEQEQRDQLSALRFKQFAQTHNKKINKAGGGKTINE